jgi:GT2 family glycosyltransferase
MKEAVTDAAKKQLGDFLESNEYLDLPRPVRPQLSVLLVLYNRAELTLTCLRSILPSLREATAEVILVDNASRDETCTLLDRIRGAVGIRNGNNVGFPVAVNQAAQAATGEFLLLLNNDTEVDGDSLRIALRFLADNRDVGAVGGRLVLLDGALQEAGCTLWREGHVLQYGRGDSPNAAQYLFQRDVDYCSAAFLMTRRELFHKMGGFDTAFSPGYFEDADYCVRLWRSGWRVVYLPDIVVHHYENASSAFPKELLRLYRRNHLIFTQKHADWLSGKSPATTTFRLRTRSSHDDRFQILYLPTRSNDISVIAGIVGRLHSLNCFVTVFPVAKDAEQTGEVSEAALPPTLRDALPPDVELLPGGTLDSVPCFLKERQHSYDNVLASDPQILQHIRRFVVQRAATAASS